MKIQTHRCFVASVVAIRASNSMGWLIAAILLLTACGQEVSTASLAEPAGAKVTVYKSPTCGCCGAWVNHLRTDGFDVTVINENDLAARKTELGVTPDMGSCHTAVVDGYVIEGHVPAADIRRLLKEHPLARGLAVPGMPAGSPGMEMGSRHDPYTVWLLADGAEPRAFAQHGGD